MEVLSFAELYNGGLSTAAVLILYKIHRDLQDLMREHSETKDWVHKIKAHLWPAVFAVVDPTDKRHD